MPHVHTIIWAAAASAMNFHTRPADFASNVVNSPWGMQITGFPPSQQDGSSHGGSTMRESSLKHICDSIFCPSAMRNPQRRSHVSRRPAARPRRSPLRSSSSTATSIFSSECEFKHRTGASPRTPEDQCCAVLPSSVHAKMCKQHWPQGGCGGR